MRSKIVIARRGRSYICDAAGRFGGGYSGVHAGDTASEAAAFAAREGLRYISTNPEGGDIIAPTEVMEHMPPKAPEDDQLSILFLRVPGQLKIRIRDAAEQTEKSVNEFCCDVLVRFLNS